MNPKLVMQKIINELNPDAKHKQLLKKYLYERQVATFVNGVFSPFGTVEIGIPQGGVLPPLLFAYYLSDLKLLNLEGGTVMYADDVQLLYAFRPNEFNNVEVSIMNDLRRVEQFFETLQMKLNQTKTTITKFGTRQQLTKLRRNKIFIGENLEIDILGNVRSLGLIYYENVTFSTTSKK